jgi:heptaprenyl diphosphate synthase
MSIQHLYDTIDISEGSHQYSELLFVEDQLQYVLTKAKGLIRQTCVTLLQSGGKRVRPLLTLYSGQCFAPINSLMIQAAVAAELIHMASLIHDDVIDQSAIRRGKETINVLHGDHAAILTGDYLFAEAFNILTSNQLLTSMKYLVQAIQAMCDGEVNQASEQYSLTVGIEQYFDRIAKKTGMLLAACCQSGALLAGASLEEIEFMREFGLNIGFAYQITDDILDFQGNAESLGKPVGADLFNGNITLPLLYLLDNPVYGTWLKEILDTRKITHQGFQSIKEALIHTGSLEKAVADAKNCICKAKNNLGKLPQSPYRNILNNLADSILYRTT